MGSTLSLRRLIINADDYGLSRGVTTGIIEAAEKGVVTSASMMVNLPGFHDAVARARSRPSLSLGLHFNLTTGRPLTAAPSLTRRATGRFYPLPLLLARASLGRVNSSQVARECAAQLDRMIEVGISPTHLDSHRHVHAHPALWPAVVGAAASRGVSNVRVPTEPLWFNAADWKATLKKTGLMMLSRTLRGRSEHIAAEHFFGLSLQGGRSFGARLFALIPNLPAGTTELMTHPGYADPGLSEHDGYTWQREEELRVLCSKELRELLQRHEIELTSFDNRAPLTASASKIAKHR
ncbi:MAG: ChbG/HpnK family deacetylase [Gemmatimonadota bacterium]|nr:ChbG/HpnK family deacetylase [Gemmatimonadota bacterium]